MQLEEQRVDWTEGGGKLVSRNFLPVGRGLYPVRLSNLPAHRQESTDGNRCRAFRKRPEDSG